MIIFSVPKPFSNEFAVIQHNAIRSWLSIKPRPQIVLMGDEEGIPKVADLYGIQQIKTIKKNKSGAPLLSSVFKIINTYRQHKLRMFINADVILLDFPTKEINKTIADTNECLIVGRRFEEQISTELELNNIDKENFTRKLYRKSGSWVDYFIFTQGLFANVPSFALGRTFWDKWLVWDTLRNKIPVIDATQDICAIHQSHTYAFNKITNRAKIWAGDDALNNLRLAGGWRHLSTIDNASHELINGILSSRAQQKTLLINSMMDGFPSLWPFFLRLRLLRERVLNRG